MSRHLHRNKPAWWWGRRRRARWQRAEDALMERLRNALWSRE